jgi:HEAT repeat protein
LVSLLVLLPTLALGAPLEAQVDELLEGIEATAKPADWQKLPPEAAAVLSTIARDPKALPTKRARAATALAYFTTAPSSETTLAELVDSDTTEISVRRSAARAYAAGFKEKALPHLQPLASHKNARLREEAVKALAVIPGAASSQLLRERTQIETDPAVKMALESALKGR